MKSACLKDDKRVEIISRNNSLCAKGRISVVSQAEPNTLFQPAIHVVQLGMVLRCFAEGWNRIHPHFFGIKFTVQWKVFTSSTTTHTPYSVQGSLQLKRAHQGGSSS